MSYKSFKSLGCLVFLSNSAVHTCYPRVGTDLASCLLKACHRHVSWWVFYDFACLMSFCDQGRHCSIFLCRCSLLNSRENLTLVSVVGTTAVVTILLLCCHYHDCCCVPFWWMKCKTRTEKMIRLYRTLHAQRVLQLHVRFQRKEICSQNDVAHNLGVNKKWKVVTLAKLSDGSAKENWCLASPNWT